MKYNRFYTVLLLSLIILELFPQPFRNIVKADTSYTGYFIAGDTLNLYKISSIQQYYITPDEIIDELNLPNGYKASDIAYDYFYDDDYGDYLTNYTYIILGNSSGNNRWGVLKVNVESFEVDSSYYNTTYHTALCGVVDSGNQYLYVGLDSSPGCIVKFSLDTLTPLQNLILDSDENIVYSLIEYNGYLYALCDSSSGSKLVKIDLSSFTKVDTLTVPERPSTSPQSIAIYTNLYFTCYNISGSDTKVIVKRVSLTSFTVTGSLTVCTVESDSTLIPIVAEYIDCFVGYNNTVYYFSRTVFSNPLTKSSYSYSPISSMYISGGLMGGSLPIVVTCSEPSYIAYGEDYIELGNNGRRIVFTVIEETYEPPSVEGYYLIDEYYVNVNTELYYANGYYYFFYAKEVDEDYVSLCYASSQNGETWTSNVIDTVEKYSDTNRYVEFRVCYDSSQFILVRTATSGNFVIYKGMFSNGIIDFDSGEEWMFDGYSAISEYPKAFDIAIDSNGYLWIMWCNFTYPESYIAYHIAKLSWDEGWSPEFDEPYTIEGVVGNEFDYDTSSRLYKILPLDNGDVYFVYMKGMYRGLLYSSSQEVFIDGEERILPMHFTNYGSGFDAVSLNGEIYVLSLGFDEKLRYARRTTSGSWIWGHAPFPDGVSPSDFETFMLLHNDTTVFYLFTDYSQENSFSVDFAEYSSILYGWSEIVEVLNITVGVFTSIYNILVPPSLKKISFVVTGSGYLYFHEEPLPKVEPTPWSFKDVIQNFPVPSNVQRKPTCDGEVTGSNSITFTPTRYYCTYREPHASFFIIHLALSEYPVFKTNEYFSVDTIAISNILVTDDGLVVGGATVFEPSGTVRWSKDIRHVSQWIITGDIVVYLCHDGTYPYTPYLLKAYSIETGEFLWSVECGEDEGFTELFVSHSPNRIFVGVYNYTSDTVFLDCYAIDGSLLWRYDTESEYSELFTISPDESMIYYLTFTGGGSNYDSYELHSIDVETRTEIVTYNFTIYNSYLSMRRMLIDSSGLVYILTTWDDEYHSYLNPVNSLFVIDPTIVSSNPYWNITMPDSLDWITATVTNTGVIVSDYNYNLTFYNVNGETIWVAQTSRQEPEVIVDNLRYVYTQYVVYDNSGNVILDFTDDFTSYMQFGDSSSVILAVKYDEEKAWENEWDIEWEDPYIIPWPPTETPPTETHPPPPVSGVKITELTRFSVSKYDVGEMGVISLKPSFDIVLIFIFAFFMSLLIGMVSKRASIPIITFIIIIIICFLINIPYLLSTQKELSLTNTGESLGIIYVVANPTNSIISSPVAYLPGTNIEEILLKREQYYESLFFDIDYVNSITKVYIPYPLHRDETFRILVLKPMEGYRVGFSYVLIPRIISSTTRVIESVPYRVETYKVSNYFDTTLSNVLVPFNGTDVEKIENSKGNALSIFYNDASGKTVAIVPSIKPSEDITLVAYRKREFVPNPLLKIIRIPLIGIGLTIAQLIAILIAILVTVGVIVMLEFPINIVISPIAGVVVFLVVCFLLEVPYVVF